MDLFTQIDDIKISKIDPFDVELRTDKYNLFLTLIREHENMYPGILKWFKEKVEPGIKSFTRVAYVGFNNDLPIATAIVKVAQVSKFCHLHIKDEYRNRHIGELFFAMMALDVKRKAEEIYFTLPESLWAVKNDFFRSFGFHNVRESKKQYRNFERELISKASFDAVWRNSLRKLPKIITSQVNTSDSIFSGILMSIQPKYIEKILSNEKIVEIRKQFNKEFEGSRVTLYATRPTKQICGYALVEFIKHDTPENIWNRYEKYLGCTRMEFNSYTANHEKIYAIFLSNVESYKNPIPLSQLNYWLDKEVSPPQSYSIINNNQHWAKAISIAEMLQGRFKTFTQVI